MTAPVQQPKFGPGDEALSQLPTVYRDDLYAGKVVLVSGAGSGIGKAIAFLFARLGATLAICGRKLDALEDCAEKLRALSGREVFVHPMTIRDPAQVEGLLDAVWERFGGIDVLVNNAGYAYRAEIGALDVAAMRAMFETNVFGLVDLTNRVVPHLKAHAFGDIINLASTSGMKGAPGGTAYSGSKWAVRGITQCWQAELRPFGIRVGCICPSEVQTNFGGRGGRNNPNKLYAADIAATILAGVHLPQRVLWTELAVFATNPWKED